MVRLNARTGDRSGACRWQGRDQRHAPGPQRRQDRFDLRHLMNGPVGGLRIPDVELTNLLSAPVVVGNKAKIVVDSDIDLDEFADGGRPDLCDQGKGRVGGRGCGGSLLGHSLGIEQRNSRPVRGWEDLCADPRGPASKAEGAGVPVKGGFYVLKDKETRRSAVAPRAGRPLFRDSSGYDGGCTSDRATSTPSARRATIRTS